jgi:hypothetical protein
VGELAGLAAVVGRAAGVAVADDLVTARCIAAAEVAGVEGGAAAGDEPVAVAKAAAERPEADADAAVDEVDPVPRMRSGQRRR